MKPSYRRASFAAILTSFLLVQLATAQISISKINEKRIGTQAMPLGVQALNLRSHQDDAVVSFNGYQYCVYYSIVGSNTDNRFVTVGRRSLPDGNWETVRLSDYTQVTNDSHNVIAMGICENDGTIHLAFDHHNNSPNIHINYRISVRGLATNPGNHNWTASKFNSTTDRLPGLAYGRTTGVTYPRFLNKPNGDLQLSRRKGSAVAGKAILYTYSADTEAWVQNGIYIEGTTDDLSLPTPTPAFYRNGANQLTKLNGYLNGLTYDGNRLHASWVWRSTGGRNFDFMYAYSDDFGRNWKNTGGENAGRIGSKPMLYQNDVQVKVFDIPESDGLANQTGQAIDSEGRIHVVQRERGRFLHIWRDLDGDWHKTRLGDISDGRYKITTDRNNNVYLLTSSAKIYAATPGNNFGDWAVAYDDDEGRFAGDAQFDEGRMLSEGILTLMVQSPGSSKNIYTIDLSVATSGTYGRGGTPGTGEAWPIRSQTTTRIQAENFDQGPNGTAYFDTDSGNTGGDYRPTSDVDIERSGSRRNVGYIRAGEWLQYSFNVSANRTYDLKVRYARNPSGSTRLRVSTDGLNLGGTFSAGSSGDWQSYRTVTKRIDLARGEQKFRIDFLDGGINIDYLEFVPILPPEDGPVAHWAFDEGSGTSASDSSGNGHNGTLRYGPNWRSDSVRGSHLRFDGNNDRIDTGFTYALSGSDDFTWSWWAKNQSNGTDDDTAIMVGNRYGGPGNQPLEFIKLTRTRSEFANGTGSARLSYPRLPATDWHHYVMVKDGNSFQLYLDGAPHGTGRDIPYSTSGAIPFKIGGDDDDNEIGGREREHFEGLIDDVVLYDRALTTDEIDAVANGTYEGFNQAKSLVTSGLSSAPLKVVEGELTTSLSEKTPQQLMTYATGQALGQTPTSIEFDENVMEFRYTRSLAAIEDQMTFEVQWSSSLSNGSWSNEGIIDSVDANAPEDELLEHRVATIPLAEETTRRFVRLKVTENVTE